MTRLSAKETSQDTPQQERLIRLHVNLNRPTANALREVAERRELTSTEAVRQAIGTWKWLDDALQRGARIQLVEEDGQVKEVMPIQ